MSKQLRKLVTSVKSNLLDLDLSANDFIPSSELSGWIDDILNLIKELDECFNAIDEGASPKEIWDNYDPEEFKDYFWDSDMSCQTGNYEAIVEKINELEETGKFPEDLESYRYMISHHDELCEVVRRELSEIIEII